MTHDELLAKIKSLQVKQMRIVYNALYAVVEIKSEDARMAKFKAQDYQDGWDSCLEAVKQAIEKELG